MDGFFASSCLRGEEAGNWKGVELVTFGVEVVIEGCLRGVIRACFW